MHLTIRENSVCGCLRINMKLQSLSIVFVFGVVGIGNLVDTVCLLRNTQWPQWYWFQCFRTNNYSADVNKAPVDIIHLTFSNSRIPVIRNESFGRLTDLVMLAVANSGLEEIEDNAFQELTGLKMLDFRENKLQVIKNAWFKGLTNMTYLILSNNRIKHMEDEFFAIMPNLELLCLINNELTSISAEAATIPDYVRENMSLIVEQNPLNWKTRILIKNLLKKTEFGADRLNINCNKSFPEIANMCTSNLTAEGRVDEEFSEECTEKAIGEFLPKEKNYTVQQLCEFLKDKPSPFLDCSE